MKNLFWPALICFMIAAHFGGYTLMQELHAAKMELAQVVDRIAPEPVER